MVPQALTGQLAQPPVEEIVEGGCGRKQRKEVILDQAFKNIFLGIAFLLVAIALSRTIGQTWWFWMLLPAFSMMGAGIAQYIRIREREKRASLVAPPVARTFPDRPRNGDEFKAQVPVPSVTEGTTRHLGVEAPTRHFDPNEPR